MLRSRVLTVLLVMSWLTCGAVASLAGFLGFFQSWLWIFLLLPFSFLCLLVWRVRGTPLIALSFIWLLHLLQVFVPETGFDALWYHLPIAELLSEQQQFTFLPELYQTANPLFADSIFSLGYLFWQSLGTKLVSFGFALTLVAITYQLGRVFLSRKWSLLLVISVSLFQVVSWQAASFYIDVAKAAFDLAGLWLVLEGLATKESRFKQKYLLLAALAFSASLASKAFSLLLLPFMLFSLAITLPISIFALVVFSVPFYLFSYQHTGSAIFSIEKHVGELGTFTNANSPFDLVLARVLEFPKAFVALFLTKDYTSPLLGFLPVALVLLRGKIFKSKPLLLLVLFTLNQLAIWWFVPPLSTRYALAGFISGLLIVFIWLSQRKEKFWPVLILLIALLSLIPRLVVAKRTLTHLAGQQTQEAYVEQFVDENNAWLLETRYE